MGRTQFILALLVVVLFVLSIIYIYQPTKYSPGALTNNIKYASINDILDAIQIRAKYLHRFDDVETVQDTREILVNDSKVQQMINDIIAEDANFFPDWFWTATMDTLVKALRRRDYGAVLVDFTKNQTQENATEGWGELDRIVRQYSVYDPDDPALKELLHRMAHSEIERIKENNVGAYLKVDVKFKDGGWAVLKPMKLPRYVKVESKYGRHHPEIAAFHLDRLLGYYRVPPTVGRYVNIQTELYPLLPQGIRRTFFVNEDGRTCFYGDCRRCSKNDTFCGDPEMAEMSLMYYLPNTGKRKDFKNYWLLKHKYFHPGAKSEAVLCNDTRVQYLKGNRLALELYEVRYFDGLTDNFDRHHYAAYTVFHQNPIPLLYDNSEAFGDPASNGVLDRTSKWGCNCCLMKKSTFLKYLKLFLGLAHLSELMRESLNADPFNPVLSDDQLTALDRRVNSTVYFMHECLKDARHIGDVILDDNT